MCSLKINDNSNECQHDILHASKVKLINKMHAQSCNRNAVRLKKQNTRTMSTLLWCLYLYKVKPFSTAFVATVKYPNLVRTFYFSGNLEEEKVLELH